MTPTKLLSLAAFLTVLMAVNSAGAFKFAGIPTDGDDGNDCAPSYEATIDGLR